MKTGMSLTLFDKINQGKDLEKTSNKIIFLGISFVNFMPCKHNQKGSHSGLLPGWLTFSDSAGVCTDVPSEVLRNILLSSRYFNYNFLVEYLLITNTSEQNEDFQKMVTKGAFTKLLYI